MGVFDFLFRLRVKRMKAKRDVKGLVKALGEEDWFRQEKAMSAVSEMGAVAIDPLIAAIEILNHGAFDVRWKGGSVYYFDGEGLEYRKKVWRARKEAIGVLGLLLRIHVKGTKEINVIKVVDVLLDALKAFKKERGQPCNEDSRLLLGDIWENDALSESRYFYAELAVARALVYIGGQAVEPLMQALNDPGRYYGHAVIAKVLSEIKSR